MRHKYDTRALVLSRTPIGEATAYVALLTEDLGLVYARAQSLRAPGAKLAHALATLSESEVSLVRGKEQWRLSGAVLEENWFVRLGSPAARVRAAHVAELLLRLVAGEARETELFPIVIGFFGALAQGTGDLHEAAEILAVLRLLAALGLDTGEIPGADPSDFSAEALAAASERRASYIARINIGISASGL